MPFGSHTYIHTYIHVYAYGHQHRSHNPSSEIAIFSNFAKKMNVTKELVNAFTWFQVATSLGSHLCHNPDFLTSISITTILQANHVYRKIKVILVNILGVYFLFTSIKIIRRFHLVLSLLNTDRNIVCKA